MIQGPGFFRSSAKVSGCYGLVNQIQRFVLPVRMPFWCRSAFSGGGFAISVCQGMAGLFGIGMYQNTGLDLFSLGLGQTAAFYDVEDTGGLLSALDQARVN
jgi:hypothetical protein